MFKPKPAQKRYNRGQSARNLTNRARNRLRRSSR